MTLEKLYCTEVNQNTAYRITTIFDDKQVLARIGESLVQTGIISGIDLRENNLGIYRHKGGISKKVQYTLAIYITTDHNPRIATLIEDTIRREIEKYWDTPVIIHDSTAVNQELADFIKQSVPTQQKIIKQRNLIRALALATILASSFSAAFFVNNYVEKERLSSLKALEVTRAEAQTKCRKEMLEKIRELHSKIFAIIKKNDSQIGCEANLQHSTPLPMATCKTHKDIMQEIGVLEKAIESKEQCDHL